MNQVKLAELVASGEGLSVEFKRSISANIGREMCAFANASGGIILVGVTDRGEIVGVDNHNRLKSSVQQTAHAADPSITAEVESIGEVLCVKIPKQQNKPYSFGGEFFMREGATSQKMRRDEIGDSFFAEQRIHFDETHCPDFDSTGELTPQKWAEFGRRAKIPEGQDPINTLHNLQLMQAGVMTRAGAWLLATDVTRYTRGAHVTCALFVGTTKQQILDSKDFKGDLYKNYEDAMAYLRAKLNTALIPHATGRDERLELPEDALREGLVNAIAHRDYRSTANVQVYIFHDRVEIVSPGGLPAGMHEKQLGVRSVPRNPLLFGILQRMDLVEKIGSGITRIRRVCEDYGVVPPSFIVEEEWFVVVFQRPEVSNATPQVTPQVPPHVTPQVTPQVADEVVRLLEVMEGELQRTDIQQLLGLKDKQHFRTSYLAPALHQGLIEMTIPTKPRSKDQRYRLTSAGRSLLTVGNATPQVPPQVPPHVTLQTTPQVAAEVVRLLGVMEGELQRGDIQQLLGLKDKQHFRTSYLAPALHQGLIEMTIPTKPRSKDQRYRLTSAGQSLLTVGNATPQVPPQVTLQVPPQVTPQVAAEVVRLLGVMEGELQRGDIQQLLGLKDKQHFRTSYLAPALHQGLIEMTIPTKPRSKDQRYRLTSAGQSLLTVGNATPQVPPQVTPQVPPQVTPQVAAEVVRLLGVMEGELHRADIQQLLGLKDKKHLRLLYLAPAIKLRLVEMTIPDKPQSKEQRYRLTVEGITLRRKLKINKR